MDLRDVIITGSGFLGSSLRNHLQKNPRLRVWNAGRADTNNSITSIVNSNSLSNFAVILNGWGGVFSADKDNSDLQFESLTNFRKQLFEIETLRPAITLGFGSQIENSVSTAEEDADKWTYATAKLRAGTEFLSTIRANQLQGKWVRIFSVYGLGMDQRWLIPQLVLAAKSGALVQLGPCNHKWGFLHIHDFCDAIEKLIFKKNVEGEFIDLGGFATRSLREIVTEIEEILGAKVAHYNPDASSSRDTVPDLSNLLSLGWQPKVSLREGILELSESYG